MIGIVGLWSWVLGLWFLVLGLWPLIISESSFDGSNFAAQL
jgi:hypothetical protein